MWYIHVYEQQDEELIRPWLIGQNEYEPL